MALLITKVMALLITPTRYKGNCDINNKNNNKTKID